MQMASGGTQHHHDGFDKLNDWSRDGRNILFRHADELCI
jgi:hypothetical protein